MMATTPAPKVTEAQMEASLLTKNEQKTLFYLVKNALKITSLRVTSRHLASKLGFHQSTASKSVMTLYKLGFVDVREKSGGRAMRVTKVLEKGLKFPFGPQGEVKETKGPLVIPDSEETGDRPWETSSVPPRPWEQKHPAVEELEKIRELVKPREGESVYEAVHALYQYACQK